MALAAPSPPERGLRRCGRDTSSLSLRLGYGIIVRFAQEALALISAHAVAEDVQRDPTPEAWTPRQVYSTVPRAAQPITYQAPFPAASPSIHARPR